eukprot:CAMPEP_0184265048 /NCGR_PEP_ID=MMETSP0977-20130417/24236_1 /TAXON_ID=483370 /ORGANISM="non described non described, Strain CCMP2097" /LENGTH=48 /DNA_ID= /DNA_START= /DNA_END= /DNA_ORIENTATION=
MVHAVHELVHRSRVVAAALQDVDIRRVGPQLRVNVGDGDEVSCGVEDF